MAESRFCLVDEKWIPIVGKGRLSLIDVFSDDNVMDIAGNAIQKIALIKLLIAIAQAAISIEDEDEWKNLGPTGLRKEVIGYLNAHKADFFLYGDHPFLQMPALADLKEAEIQKIYYDFIPDLASENDTLIRELQSGHALSDEEKAVFLVQLMNYAPGGKRTSYIRPLTPGYSLRTKSAKAGPSLGGYEGYLQTCLLGCNLMETVWLNFFTESDLLDIDPSIRLDVRPPWEKMPEGEEDEIAQAIKHSVYAWLIGVSRFILLSEEGIRYAEGLQYPTSTKSGYSEPFITIRDDGGAIYASTVRKPWRSLVSILQVVYDSSSPYSCSLIKAFLRRARSAVSSFSIWSGGLKIRGTSGDQSVKQDDDYVESEFSFESSLIGEEMFQRLSSVMKELDRYAGMLRSSVVSYKKDFKEEPSAANAEKAFWESAESVSQDLIRSCADEADEERVSIMRFLKGTLVRIYDENCPHDTARQLMVWMNHRPFSGGKDGKTE